MTGGALAQEPAPPKPMPPPPVAEIKDPAVLAVMEGNPTTPEELVRAIRTLVLLRQPQYAKNYVKTLNQAQLDDAAMAGLVQKFGSDAFMSMARQESLQPEGAAVARKILAGAEKHGTDPARLEGLIKQLQDPTAAARVRAVVQLKSGGAAAVNALLAVLADDGRQAEHSAARTALVGQESNAIEPLIAALHSNEDGLKTHVTKVLAELYAEKALPFLLAPAHDEKGSPELRAAASSAIQKLTGRQVARADAVRYLRSEATEFTRGVFPAAPDANGRITIWDWDADKKQAVAKTLPAEDASWLYAYWLSRDLWSLQPDDPAAQRLYLMCLFQNAAFQQGLDKPIDPAAFQDAAAAVGPDAISEVLRDALIHGRTPAALAACKLLGEAGSADLLNKTSGPSPLIAAAQHPDRRLRFASLETIMKWQPEKPYAGSATVAQSLAFLASSRGVLQVIVADRAAPSARLAGPLAELGYEPSLAASGRDVLRQAIASPDVAFVIVDSWLAGVEQSLQQLRADHRTASLPIMVLNNPDDPDAAQKLADRHQPAVVIYRAATAKEMEFQINLLLELVGREFVSLAERQQHASAALQWLAQLAQRGGMHDLRGYDRSIEPGLYRPETVVAAADCLASLGTPFGQRTLVELASQATAPLESRQAAASAFAKGVERHGILLNTQEIQRQYERYNASEKLDGETQRVLSSILDTIESRWKKEEKMPEKAEKEK